MTLWAIVIIASIAGLAVKISGYLVPAEFMEREKPSRVAGLLTVALLAALVATQSLASGQQVEIDARVPAIFVAAALFALRVPFILVIVAAALTAAIIRATIGG
ncbi:AzlD domain-containing protein [Salinibacterium sp. dk2585]|uniref:AzlD domain-containing protein n=1 Tax=unclassified Salinibacterium TaxID=2632331 RepID=UPI0011C2458D|nr:MULTISPECIES: AzlD domain-containing protein [unclassified Salinibacterium]QEE61375.1 AzlD domain-containing protein [Salinibacterium sp. dk2585]TXK54052.1 AzlD domain-containing protein [Salinibacterium sp. dk5596]